jgi:hypothetical protein
MDQTNKEQSVAHKPTSGQVDTRTHARAQSITAAAAAAATAAVATWP